MNNEECAKVFVEAIKTIVSKPDNLDNFESYLSYHFDVWMEKFANSPEGLTSEVKHFAEMEIWLEVDWLWRIIKYMIYISMEKSQVE